MDDFLQDLGHLALGTRLKRAGVALQATTQRWLQDQGCTIPAAQLPVIAILHRHGATAIGELAQRLGIAQPGVTRMVDQLAAGDWVTSGSGRGDKRVREVRLTGKGRRFAVQAGRAHWPAIEQAVARLCEELSGPFIDQLTGLENKIEDGELETALGRAKSSSGVAT